MFKEKKTVLFLMEYMCLKKAKERTGWNVVLMLSATKRIHWTNVGTEITC